MKVRVSGESVPWTVLEAVCGVLNYGRIKPQNVAVVSGGREIVIPFSRRAGGRGRTSREYQPGDGRGRQRQIGSVFTIRNVRSHSLHADEEMPVIMVLFGAKIEGRKIVICSAEEDHGFPCFLLEVEVDTLDIDVCDVADQI